MASVVTEFIRRIEKVILGSRPKIPPVGTNHVDDYSQWTNDTIYKGELGINLTEGNLFTQDGRQVIELNTELIPVPPQVGVLSTAPDPAVPPPPTVTVIADPAVTKDVPVK